MLRQPGSRFASLFLLALMVGCGDGSGTPGDTTGGTGGGGTGGTGATPQCMPADCDDDNPCTSDSCRVDQACVNEQVSDQTACDFGGLPGICKSGVCEDAKLCEDVVCNDGDDCTDDLCDPATGACSSRATPNGTPCADGTCMMGECIDDGVFVDLCAEQAQNGVVVLSEQQITEDTLFASPCIYVLTGPTFVAGGTLSIEAGVQVVGDNGAALVVTTRGHIDARGTVEDPIVFTSSRPEGNRLPGDWGGVVLLGDARLSWGASPCDGDAGECVANIDGLAPATLGGRYGGDDDTHDCGTLHYVRIEYAGFVFGDDNELNGLTVAGCGSDTDLDYIQVHRGFDDGVELFGGTASLSHIVVDGIGDDCFDIDQGYRGTISNAICHHYNPSNNDPSGIEADNYADDNDVEPRSNPTFQYLTMIGSPGFHAGIVLGDGTWGTVDSAVVAGFPGPGVDLRDGAWAVAPGWPNAIRVTNSCFFGNTPNYPTDIDCDGDGARDCNDRDDDDNFFPEDLALPAIALGNREEDPLLGDVSGATNGSIPDYSVGNASCMGAFAPNGVDWTVGWTDFTEE